MNSSTAKLKLPAYLFMAIGLTWVYRMVEQDKQNHQHAGFGTTWGDN